MSGILGLIATAQIKVVEWWNIMVQRWKMPSLNIKDEEIHRKAHELAKLTGESVTAAVGAAINERLDREQRIHKRHNRLEWLLQLSKETSALMNDGRTSKELMDELYDPETGLPV